MPMVQEICSKIKLAEIDEKFHCLSDFFFFPFNLNSIQISYFIVSILCSGEAQNLFWPVYL